MGSVGLEHRSESGSRDPDWIAVSYGVVSVGTADRRTRLSRSAV